MQNTAHTFLNYSTHALSYKRIQSSLYKALLQITDHQETISVGGIDCKEIPLSILREHISVSPEHNNLFFTSVYENIQYGNLNSTKEDIFSVMQQAAISDISLS